MNDSRHEHTNSKCAHNDADNLSVLSFLYEIVATVQGAVDRPTLHTRDSGERIDRVYLRQSPTITAVCMSGNTTIG